MVVSGAGIGIIIEKHESKKGELDQIFQTPAVSGKSSKTIKNDTKNVFNP